MYARKVQFLGFWGFVDYWSHKLPTPNRLQQWICDRFDRALGWEGDWSKAEVLPAVEKYEIVGHSESGVEFET